MKSKYFLSATLLIFFLAIHVSFAQQGMGRNACRIPDLSGDQKTRIETLRTQQLTSSTQYRARMDELRARQHSLRIAENPDMGAINNVIDQMERLRAEHLKQRENHIQQVRNILTPEQKAIFDSNAMNMRQGRGPGFDRPREGRRGFSGPQQGRRR
jgi:Spy/CpxP family protein refolding chaperone